MKGREACNELWEEHVEGLRKVIAKEVREVVGGGAVEHRVAGKRSG